MFNLASNFLNYGRYHFIGGWPNLGVLIVTDHYDVLFSGESGAGKTVSAKHIMNFIAKASGKGSEKVEVRKIDSGSAIGVIQH